MSFTFEVLTRTHTVRVLVYIYIYVCENKGHPAISVTQKHDLVFEKV